MQTLKQDALDAIARLPDSADLEDILYGLYVIDKIRRARESVESEPTSTVDEVRKDVESW